MCQHAVAIGIRMNLVGLVGGLFENITEYHILNRQLIIFSQICVEFGARQEDTEFGYADQHDLGTMGAAQVNHLLDVGPGLLQVLSAQDIVAAVADDDQVRLVTC